MPANRLTRFAALLLPRTATTRHHRASVPSSVRNAGWVLAVALLSGCAADGSTRETDADSTGALLGLVEWMSGSFSSADQAKSDPEFREIELHIAVIWPERLDGPWLYLEYAAAGSLSTPYRQRVYQLAPALSPELRPGTIESRVFELPGDPLALAGAWREPSRLDVLVPRDLLARDGCSIFLIQDLDGAWLGSTAGTECPSALRGATYATSELAVSPTEIRAWDRGFDAEGRQVWGALAGAYIFRRTNPGLGPASTPPSAGTRGSTGVRVE